MPAYHVQRSVRINADDSKVRPAIEDFNEWPKWSPWLCMEPTARISVFGTPGQTDHGYDWDGELVGAGSMRIASVGQGKQHMDLAFLRPFKSKAKVMFEIKPIGDAQTEVTWHMDGKMPFFLFFMIGMMKAMIGMDFARGLKMLKEYVETGSVKSKIEIAGIVDVPNIHYLGVEAHCTMDEIGDSMGKTMPAVHKCVVENHIETVGPPGSLYHDVDLKRQTFHYTSIVQTKSPTKLGGVETGTIAPCKALKVIHTGSYDHLGNAWSTAMAYQRYKKLKPLKSQCSFEFYSNDPDNTPAEDLITEIFVPIRG
jgi:effector-binding domain-containing protein